MKFSKFCSIVFMLAIMFTFSSCIEKEDPQLSVSPSNLIFDYQGEAFLHDAFNIVSNEDWTIDNNTKWIHLDKISGEGDGKITVNVDNYHGTSDRNATIIINSISGLKDVVTITQTAQPAQPEAPIHAEDQLLGNWDMYFIDNGWDDIFTVYMDINFYLKEGSFGNSYKFLAKVYYDLDGDGKYSDYKGNVEGYYRMNLGTNKFIIENQDSTLPSEYKIVLNSDYDIEQLNDQSFNFNDLNISLRGHRRSSK